MGWIIKWLLQITGWTLLKLAWEALHGEMSQSSKDLAAWTWSVSVQLLVRGTNHQQKRRGRRWPCSCRVMKTSSNVGRTQGERHILDTFYTNNCVLVCKQIPLGKIFYSTLDSSHSYFIVISHPPNWLCLKHISGLDCENWGLSTPNSHIITTWTVLPSPPENAHHPSFPVQTRLSACHSLQAWNPI